MPRALYFVLPLVTLFLLCLTPHTSKATVWDATYQPAKVFKAKQNINIRSGPSSGSRVLGVMKRGQTATVPAMEKGWYKVILPDGVTGYIYKKFMEPVPGAQPAPPAETQKAKAPDAAPAPKPETAQPQQEQPDKAHHTQRTTKQVKPATPEPQATEAAPKAKPAEHPSAQQEPAASAQEGQPMQPAREVEETPIKPATPPTASIQIPADPVRTSSTGVDCARIKFKNNALTGTFEQTISKGGNECYEINLEKSQWMEVWLSSPEDAAMFEIFSPTGSTLCSREIHWLGRSEQAGEYIIFISQDAGSGPYTLKILVK